MATHCDGRARLCITMEHYPRLRDCLHNRIMLAGIRLGTTVTDDTSLRTRLRRLAAILEEDVSPVKLSGDSFRQLRAETNRLTTAYGPVMTIVKMLHQSEGITLEDTEFREVRLRAFLFDMQKFFETLMQRFLKENLRGLSVYDQYRIRGMMSYLPEHNPRHRRSPEPRPDYAILSGPRVVMMLDAKYRDLGERDLPREMLYQLAIYALSQDLGGQATIMYPTTRANDCEARIQIADPVSGKGRAQVILRPVDLVKLDALLCGPHTTAQQRGREEYAQQLVFGEKPKQVQGPTCVRQAADSI